MITHDYGHLGRPTAALRTERLLLRTSCPAAGHGRVAACSATSSPTNYLPTAGRCNSCLVVSNASLPVAPLRIFPVAVSAGCWLSYR